MEKSDTTGKNKNLILGEVPEDQLNNFDCDTNIDGYPTIRVYKGGKKVKDYKGMRDANSIIKFIKKTAKSAKKKIF